jgi:hypothetical protein
MADGYRIAGRIISSRAGVAGLGTPGAPVSWAFGTMAEELGRPIPDARHLEVLKVAKQRFFKAGRMTPGGYALAMALIAFAAAAVTLSLWLLLTPHGTALFIAGLLTIACLGIYFASDKAYVKPVALAVFDVIAPALLAIPLVGAARLQLTAGRLWLSLGSAKRYKRPS